MLGAFIAFVVLFGIVRFFAARVIIGLIYPDPNLMFIAQLVVLIGMTFYLLRQILKIPGGRSAMYTLAVVLVNEGVGFALYSLQAQG